MTPDETPHRDPGELRAVSAGRPHRTGWNETGLLLVLLALFFFSRLPFREAVLIRDEGEYAYLGQRILQGEIPYLDIYNQKTPFVFYLMALFQWIGGESVAALRVATTLYGMLTLALVYLLSRRIFGPGAGFWAGLAFCIMTFDQCGILHQASTEYFLLLWTAVTLLLWHLGRTRGAVRFLFGAGVAAGLAYQTKQSGLALLGFLVVEPIWHGLIEQRRSKTGLPHAVKGAVAAFAGFGSVLVLVLLIFWFQGALSAYVECTWTNNQGYIGARWTGPGDLVKLVPAVLSAVAGRDAGLWLLGAAGLVAAGVRRGSNPGRGLWILLLGVTLAAFMGGMAFRHYYEPLIVPFALGCAAAAMLVFPALNQKLRRWTRLIGIALLLVPFGIPLAADLEYFRLTPDEFEHMLQAFPPFDVSQDVAAYIASRTEPDDPILVVGSEPQIYFYARRRAGSRMIFTYPITGPYSFAPRLKAEFLDDLRSHRSRYVLICLKPGSVSAFPDRMGQFLRPIIGVVRNGYTLEAKLPAGTEAEAANDAVGYFLVFRRNSG